MPFRALLLLFLLLLLVVLRRIGKDEPAVVRLRAGGVVGRRVAADADAVEEGDGAGRLVVLLVVLARAVVELARFGVPADLEGRVAPGRDGSGVAAGGERGGEGDEGEKEEREDGGTHGDVG